MSNTARSRKSFPKALSPGEEEFALHCRSQNLAVEREYHFALPRYWRFDFAFPDEKIAVEIEGGTWNGGRHTRGKGHAADLEKYNYATRMGWRVLRYTTEMVKSGVAIDDVLETMTNMKSHDYEHPGQIVGGIEWSMPPQPPRRRCITCNCYLRQGNLGKDCAACERKAKEAEMQLEDKKITRPESLIERLLRWDRDDC